MSDDELTIDSGALIFATLADVYLSSGMVDEAISILKDGLSRNPTYTLAKIILGRAYYMKSDIDEAIKHLEEAIKEAKDSENANLFLGHCYRKKGDIDKALRHYEAVLEINPQHTEARQEIDALKPAGIAPVPDQVVDAVEEKAISTPEKPVEAPIETPSEPPVVPAEKGQDIAPEGEVEVREPAVETTEPATGEAVQEPEEPPLSRVSAGPQTVDAVAIGEPVQHEPVVEESGEPPAGVKEQKVEEPQEQFTPPPGQESVAETERASTPEPEPTPTPMPEPEPEATPAPMPEPEPEPTPAPETPVAESQPTPPPAETRVQTPAPTEDDRTVVEERAPMVEAAPETKIPFATLQEPVERLLHLKTVKGAFICSNDGLLIQNYYQESKEIEEICAMIAAIYNEAEESFKFLKEGTVEKFIIEKENETICVITAGESLLTVITKKETKPGLIFVYAKKIIDEIREILG